MHKQTIALLDDNTDLLEGYVDFFRAREYEVHAFDSAAKLDEHLVNESVAVFILDLSFPGESDAGLRYCSSLRHRFPLIPIVIHSALDRISDKVSAYRLGADDYVVKASEGGPEYLMVVVQAHLSRVRQVKGALEKQNAIVENRRLKLNSDTRKVTWDGSSIDLTEQEYLIVSALYENFGKTLSYQKLMSAAGMHVTVNTLTVTIGKIRKKFKDADTQFGAIQNSRNHGYRWYYVD